MSVGGFSSSSTQRQLVLSFGHSSLFALAFYSSSVRSSFPCGLSFQQEEPHTGRQGWLGGGWSLALDALPGSPQVPRSYNPQLLPALGLLGPQIELQAGHRRCQRNRRNSRAHFQGSLCPSVQDSSRWRPHPRTRQETQVRQLGKSLHPLLLLILLRFQMLPQLPRTGPQRPHSPR